MQVTRVAAKAIYMRLIVCLLSVVIYCPSTFAEGALAVRQQDGEVGYSAVVNRSSEAEAKRVALQSCDTKGPGCELKTTFRNTCMAFAWQIRGNGWAWDTANTVREAQRAALKRCEQFGSRCDVRYADCDTIDESVELARQRDDEAQRQKGIQERRKNACLEFHGTAAAHAVCMAGNIGAAYLRRGEAKEAANDFDGALQDYERAKQQLNQK